MRNTVFLYIIFGRKEEKRYLYVSNLLVMTTINSFNLSIDGLKINFTTDGINNQVFYDPKATCNHFQAVGIIEGFDVDKNGEPVILFSVPMEGKQTTGYCLWIDFVKSFPFSKRMAEMCIEVREEQKLFNTLKGRIKYLLAPLATA